MHYKDPHFFSAWYGSSSYSSLVTQKDDLSFMISASTAPPKKTAMPMNTKSYDNPAASIICLKLQRKGILTGWQAASLCLHSMLKGAWVQSIVNRATSARCVPVCFLLGGSSILSFSFRNPSLFPCDNSECNSAMLSQRWTRGYLPAAAT